MQKTVFGWFSPALQKEMPVVRYGDYGFALLLIPTAAADYLEYERFQLIEALRPFIEAGKLNVFSINSINSESWLNNDMLGEHKAIRQNQFNKYVLDEVIPYIKTTTSAETPIITCGASFGALHSMNLFLKRPDLINGVIAMSGVYDLTAYTKAFYDEQVYFNSPVHYLPHLRDEWYLNHMKRSTHIHLLSGSGDHEDPAAANQLSQILNGLAIPHELSIWGAEWNHDWPTWRAMLPYYIEHRW